MELIKTALTVDSHFGKLEEGDRKAENKPVCLIVDEIDGALAGGLNSGFNKITDFFHQCIHKNRGKTDINSLQFIAKQDQNENSDHDEDQ